MPFTQDEINNMRRAGVPGLCNAPTERETLDRALGVTEEAVADVNLDAIHIDRGLLRTLRNAARKHLETLPKPVWRVTGTLYGGGAAAAYETSSRKEALDFARSYLDGGIYLVSVRQVSP